MASTHTTNLGIEKIGFGEQDGTWGTVTNTNFDLIDEAINGIVTVSLPAIGTSGTPNDIDITEGTSSDGRNAFIELTDGGDLGGTAFVRITPNDAEKIVFIRNSLTASRAVNVFQGTYNASNDYTVTAGEDVILKFDGAGTGAVVSSVLLNPRLTAVFTDTISENTAATGVTIEGVLLKDSIVAVDTINESTPAAGVTIDGVLLKDNGITMIGALDADTITTAGALTLQSFGATAVTLNSADVTVDLPLKVDQIDDISGLGVFIEGVKLQTDVLYVDTINELTPTLGVTIEGTLNSTIDDAVVSGVTTAMTLTHTTSGTTANGIGVGLDFVAETTAGNEIGAQIEAVVTDVTSASEDFDLAFNLMAAGAAATERMRITAAGNVGIGVTAPERLLHVRRGAGAGTVTDGSTYLAVLDSNADCVLQLRSPDTDTQFIRFSTPSAFSRAAISYNGTSSDLTLQSDAQTSFNTGGGNERMRIDSSGNVGIGLTSPAYTFDVTNIGTDFAPAIRARDNGAASSWARLDLEHRLASGPFIMYQTNAGQVGIRNDSTLTAANMTFVAGGTGNPSEFVFQSAVGTEVMRIDSVGNVLVGGTATPTSSVGNLALFNGTAPTAGPANGIVLYSEDVTASAELKVMDEANNITTLSPHNFSLIPDGPSEDMAWAHYSERDGKKINVDMLKLARLMEGLTGEKLVYQENS